MPDVLISLVRPGQHCDMMVKTLETCRLIHGIDDQAYIGLRGIAGPEGSPTSVRYVGETVSF